MNLYKFRHFYINKYILSLFKKDKYYLSYDYRHNALWFRTYKVASRSIDKILREESGDGAYIYGSSMAYSPKMFKRYFKFAFVRNPEARFVSMWKDKVLQQNYFRFSDAEHEKMKEIDHFISWVEGLEELHDEHLKAQCSLIDLNNIDFIGRFEHLQRDFKILSERIGLDSSKLDHSNRSIQQKTPLTHEQRLRIYHIYRKDFEIFYPDYLEVLMNDRQAVPSNEL